MKQMFFFIALMVSSLFTCAYGQETVSSVLIKNSKTLEKTGSSAKVYTDSITLIKPNGGETWSYFQSDTIQFSTSWEMVNDPYKQFSAKISYDKGATWRFMETYIYPYGGHLITWIYESAWLEATTDSALIMINYTDSTVVKPGISDGYIKIRTNGLHLNIPEESGQTYYSGQDFGLQLSLNYGYLWVMPFINIDFTSDNGITWNSIATNIPSQPFMSIPLQVPNTPSDSCRIRIRNNINLQSAYVGNLFKIRMTPYLNIISPAENDILQAGSEINIVFKTDNKDYNCFYYMEYSLDNGLTWEWHVGGSFPTMIPGNIDTSFSLRMKMPYGDTDNFLIQLFSYNPNVLETVKTRLKNFPLIPICNVSTSENITGNTIAWNQPYSKYIDTYVVYKETALAGVYDEIQRLKLPCIAAYTDTSARPSIRADRYAIGFADSSGLVYPHGIPHQTIHLNISKGMNITWNLIWSAYEGYDVESYKIYRGTDLGDLNLLATVSGNITSYTDYTNGNNNVYYIVEAVNNEMCNNHLNRNSKSNIVTNQFLVTGNIPAGYETSRVYPNPATDKVTIENNSHFAGEVIISIFNINGVLLNQGKFINQNRIEMNVNMLAKGVYWLKIQTKERLESKKLVIL